MEIFASIVFFVSFFIIFWAMIGYPFSLKLINWLLKPQPLKKDYSFQPTVTVMVVAHNEEKVIEEKLMNLLQLDYPKNKIEFLVSSDNSTDRTNEIVRRFIRNHPEYNIRLYEVKQRKGKTNAQNEAQKTVKSEILVMTDANSILEISSIKELVSSFISDDICYVCGKLIYINKEYNDVSNLESTYWDSETILRKIESNIYTITAGNGALYACRNKDYYDFDPIQSHDINMPIHYALQGKKALFNPDAIAYEKAGEVIEDEFKRKVRMNRRILWHILPSVRILNVLKYHWFTYFYFGHRTCRYLLWISHLFLLLSNILLISESLFYKIFIISQTIFYLLALIKTITKININLVNYIYYYCVTIIAQWAGVFSILTGKSKPFWDKAETTR